MTVCISMNDLNEHVLTVCVFLVHALYTGFRGLGVHGVSFGVFLSVFLCTGGSFRVPCVVWFFLFWAATVPTSHVTVCVFLISKDETSGARRRSVKERRGDLENRSANEPTTVMKVVRGNLFQQFPQYLRPEKLPPTPCELRTLAEGAYMRYVWFGARFCRVRLLVAQWRFGRVGFLHGLDET